MTLKGFASRVVLCPQTPPGSFLPATGLAPGESLRRRLLAWSFP